MERLKNVWIKKYSGELSSSQEDRVVTEAPFTIFLNDEELATLVCTPENLEELAIGFLYSDGIITKCQDIKEIKIHEQDGLIWVDTHQPTPAADSFLKRYITTCCGKGRPSFYFVNDAQNITPLSTQGLTLSPPEIRKMVDSMEDKSHLFKSTGGAHGAALCNNQGIVAFFEDIGRHNAVDKIIGYCLINKVNLSDKVITITGRISSEILLKIARTGISTIISRSAPTYLALQLADELGITVVGFARENRLNVYTHSERVC